MHPLNYFIPGIEYNGEKADVWSLGVVLFTMVTGRMPFDDGDMANLKQQIKLGVVFRKPKQPVSEDCKDLIRKMLTRNQHHRITVSEIKQHQWLQTDSAKFNISNASRSNSTRTINSI